MVPVRQGNDQLLVILAPVWVFRVCDGENLTESIWKLATCVRVVPIGPCLLDLTPLLDRFRISLVAGLLTVKL